MITRVVLFLFISTLASYSQTYKTVKELSINITNENDNDSIKVTKICNWITKHIKLNTKAFKTPIILSNSEIISKKPATNQGYSNLFSDMLNSVNIKNHQITGYYKGIFNENGDEFFRANHIWNSAFINNKWYLFDITLASGYIQNTSTTNADLQKLKWVKSLNKDMLFADIQYFRKTHLPLNKWWQLSNTPINISEFEQNIFGKKKNENYNFLKEINKINTKKPRLSEKIKLIDNTYKNNPKNNVLIGLKYNIQAIEAFSPLQKRTVRTDAEYKEIVAQINKYNKLASLEFASHIREIKKQNKQKLAKNKKLSSKNLREISDGTKQLNKDIALRQKTILHLNKKYNTFLNLIEAYEKNKTNNSITDINVSTNTKLNIEFSEIAKINNTINKINIDTIIYSINSITTLEDSLIKVLKERYKYEKQRTTFINNFSFNRLGVYNNVSDSIILYKKLSLNLENEFNQKADTLYFNIEPYIKLLVKQAEAHYKKAKVIITSKKLDNSVLNTLNNSIDSVYTNSQNILKANTASFKHIIKKLNKDFFNISKTIIAELETQNKLENQRYINFNEFYNSLMNNEVILFNSFIEICNKRITKPFIDYKKKGIENIAEVKLIFIE